MDYVLRAYNINSWLYFAVAYGLYFKQFCKPMKYLRQFLRIDNSVAPQPPNLTEYYIYCTFVFDHIEFTQSSNNSLKFVLNSEMVAI